ncbi:MAG: hypothetical protein R3B60_01560 [Candidatus Paceibacterota bacterium]
MDKYAVGFLVAVISLVILAVGLLKTSYDYSNNRLPHEPGDSLIFFKNTSEGKNACSSKNGKWYLNKKADIGYCYFKPTGAKNRSRN